MKLKTEYTADDRQEIGSHLATAAFHLAACWDSLRELEGITEAEVETENRILQSVAAEVDCPAEPLTVDADTVQDFLDSLDDEEEA